MALDSRLIERVDSNDREKVTVGDVGVTESRLNPVGKAIFGEHVVEVHSHGAFIGEGTPVEIVQVSGTRIIVRKIGDDVTNAVA
jgi:membrane-bound ClpP family serine protease